MTAGFLMHRRYELSMLPIQRILCPLDFSEPSYNALQVAIEMASHFKAELLLAHIVAPTVLGPDSVPVFALGGQDEHERIVKEATAELQAAVKQRIPIALKARTTIGSGDAADEIVRLSKEDGVDLIVMSTHGLTGWRHLVFGSVAEKVVRLSIVPVLVIPTHEAKGN
jgi:nucleotide-binding universal stress UspA family protein